MGKKKSGMAWLKNPLIYVPLIGLFVYVAFFRPLNNNVVRGNQKAMITVPAKDGQGQYLLICWKSDSILVQDQLGNRYLVPEEATEGIEISKLKQFNTEYGYYIKAESPETLFAGITLDEVEKKTGDYVLGNVEIGEYHFPQVIAVQGKVRHYGLTVVFGGNGLVSSVKLSDYTDYNWFGALPFYDDIVSLNMYNPFATRILKDVPEPRESRGFFMGLLILLWNIVKFFLFILIYLCYAAIVFAIPLCVLFPILRLFSFIKSAPNWLIGLAVWGIGLVVIYAMTIIQTEYSHSLWLITLPINLIVGFSMVGIFYGMVDNGRCPKCRKDDALTTTRKAISEHTLTKERENATKGNLSYVGQKGDQKIYNREWNHTTTEQEVVTTEYIVIVKCKYCDYTNQYTASDTEKGAKVETGSWTESSVVKRRIEPEPTYRNTDSDTIVDEQGRHYDRVEGQGVNSVLHNGDWYEKR